MHQNKPGARDKRRVARGLTEVVLALAVIVSASVLESAFGLTNSAVLTANVLIISSLVLLGVGVVTLARSRRRPAVQARASFSAGWYLDPTNSAIYRYWDGSAWTPHWSHR